MDENMKRLQAMLKNTNYKGNKSDEFIWTISCVDYYYYQHNIGLVDIQNGFIDGSGDGGIDYIYGDEEYVYLIQGKTEKDFNYKKVKEAYRKILETVKAFEDKNTEDFNSKLKRIYKNTYDKLTDPKIKFVIFTDKQVSRDLESRVKALNQDKEYKKFELEIYGKDQIQNQQQVVDNGFMTVPEDCLLLADENYLSYKNTNGEGAIFTIKACSLKDIYDKYRDNGLYGYNLREHFKYKAIDVDGEIEKTIKNSKDDFWFYNNGITIGCSNFEVNKNTLTLFDFSIINGAQTTTKIGETKDIKKSYDFNIICKVIKAKDSLGSAFIKKISEASNSQKPIVPRDLKANSAEQRKLQHKFLNNGQYKLDIEIKRGVKSKIEKLEKWQNITNAYLGQVILATQYQRPGTARNRPKGLFEDNNLYKLVFDMEKVKSYDYNTLYDLVRLGHLYDEYKKKNIFSLEKKIQEAKSKNKSYNSLEKLNDLNTMCVNAQFATMAIIAYYIKKYYFKLGKIDFEDTNNHYKLEEKMMHGYLSLNYHNKDYTKKITKLFDFIIKELLELYNNVRIERNYSSVSNFLKRDDTYRIIILHHFNVILNNPEKKEIIDECISIFDDSENKK